MDQFDALLSELGVMAKAIPMLGEDKVEAAAKEAGATMPLPDEEDGKKKDAMAKGEGEGEGDEEMFGKSFAVTMEDGSTQECFDGTAMMKAMGAQVVQLRAVVTGQHAQQEATASDLVKALQVSTGLMALVKQQGELLKSMRTDLAAVGNQGRGRTAALTIVDKPGAPAAALAPNGGDVMAKAMTAYHAGNLHASDIARLESHLGRGNAAPADIVARLPA